MEETIIHEVTAEEIADNNLGEVLEPGDTIEIPAEETTEETSVEAAEPTTEEVVESEE